MLLSFNDVCVFFQALRSRDSLQLEYTDCLLDKNHLRKRIAELQANMEQQQREVEKERERCREQMEQSSPCLHCVSEQSAVLPHLPTAHLTHPHPLRSHTVPPVSVERGPVLRPLLFPRPGSEPTFQRHPSCAEKGRSDAVWETLLVATQTRCYCVFWSIV